MIESVLAGTTSYKLDDFATIRHDRIQYNYVRAKFTDRMLLRTATYALLSIRIKQKT